MTDVYEKIDIGLSEENTNDLPQIANDLTKIKGIGSGTAEKLNVRKIYTYRQLAEISPEKLSEAPGIGIATARKIIEEAKNFLGEFQGQNSEVENIETREIVEILVEEEVQLNEFIKQENVTPYEQLLSRSDDKAESPNLELEEIEELQIEEKTSETVQKPWFNEKFNRSRLSGSYPAVLERRSKESKVKVEEIEIEPEFEEEEEIEEYQEEVPAESENNAIVEPFESEISVLEEEVPSEENFYNPMYTTPPEVTKIAEVEVQKVPETIEIPTRTRTRVPNPREELANEIGGSLKNLGYYSIPNALESLSPFFQNIDHIGLKLVPVKNNSKLIVMVPIKFCDLEGTILVHEDKIDYKAYSKTQGSNMVLTARRNINELLRAKDAMFEDVVSGVKFRNLVEKYFQVKFAAKKSVKNKKLYFVSGQTQYKVLIEPILITKMPAKCMEKSILYPYQRKTNLHVINSSDIGHLLRFLEKKYKLIESRAKKTNSIETYQNADAKFRSSLRIASLPFLGYSVVLLVIYFSQLYFLLRLFNSIGFAAIGIYSLALAYFYFKFNKTRKELTTEFETPYYLQNAQFSETDLLCVKEEFTREQMAQFGYECFGKDKDSKVLEQVEKDAILESVSAKRQELEAPQLFELDSDQEYSSIKDKPKHEIKYSSFFED